MPEKRVLTLLLEDHGDGVSVEVLGVAAGVGGQVVVNGPWHASSFDSALGKLGHLLDRERN